MNREAGVAALPVAEEEVADGAVKAAGEEGEVGAGSEAGEPRGQELAGDVTGV